MHHKYFVIAGLLVTTLAVGVATAWAGKIVTLAEDMILPPMTQNNCSFTELEPVPMKTFSHVTFMGKGTDQFYVYHVFSIEPVKFSVPAPSGKTYGGACQLKTLFSAPLTPTSMLICDSPYANAAPYVAVALLNCLQVPVTVTVKAYLK